MEKENKKERVRQFDEESLRAFAIQSKKYRLLSNLSQKQAGFESGLGERIITRIELAQANITLSTITALARTYEVSLPLFLNFSISRGNFYELLIGELGNVDYLNEIDNLKEQLASYKKENEALKARIKELESK